MDGHDHNGILLVTNSSMDPAAADQWNEWYVGTHIGETLEFSGFDAASRFELAEGFELPDGATHAAVYETPMESGAAAMAKIAETMADGREMTWGPKSRRALIAPFSKIFEYRPHPPTRAQGVVLVFANCPDPSAEDEFNRFLDEHGKHIVDEQPHVAVTRYRADDPQEGGPTYLAIYETDDPDPGRVQREGWDWYFNLPEEERGGPMPPFELWAEVAMERRY